MALGNEAWDANVTQTGFIRIHICQMVYTQKEYNFN